MTGLWSQNGEEDGHDKEAVPEAEHHRQQEHLRQKLPKERKKRTVKRNTQTNSEYQQCKISYTKGAKSLFPKLKTVQYKI